MNSFYLFRPEGIEPLPHAHGDLRCQALVLGWILASPGIQNDVEWLVTECEHFSIAEADALSAVCTGFAEWYDALLIELGDSAGEKLRAMLQTYQRLMLKLLEGTLSRDAEYTPVDTLPSMRMLMEHLQNGSGNDEQQLMFDSFVTRFFTKERLDRTAQLMLDFDAALDEEAKADPEAVGLELEANLSEYANTLLAKNLQDELTLQIILQRLSFAIRNICSLPAESQSIVSSVLSSFSNSIVSQ